MSKLWKISSAAMSVMLALFLGLGGCAGKIQNGDPKTTGKEAPKETAKASLPPVELTYYLVFGAQQADQDAVFEAANKITKEKINTTVKYVVTDAASYEDKIKVVLASGDGCDILWTSSWKNNYIQNVAKGAYLALDDLLAKYGQGMLKDIPKILWDGMRIDGKVYGIPSYQITSKAEPMLLKKDLVDKYKFDYKSVKNLEDVEPFLKACKDGGDACIAQAAGAPIGRLWNNQTMHLGFESITDNAPGMIRFSDSSLKVINQYTTDEFKKLMKLARSWYNSGYIQKDVLSIKAEAPADIKAGKYVLNMGGNLPFDGGAAANHKSNNGYDVYEIPLSDPIFLTSNITSTINSITKTCKNPDRAIMYEEFLNSSPELLNLLGYGIEGKHYTKVNDTVINMAPDSKYNTAWNWAIGNSFKMYVKSPQPPDYNQKVLETHAKAKSSPLLGFVFNAESVKTEVAQCKSVLDEFLPALTTGAVDPDQIYVQFLDKLEKAGASKVIAEEQKQIDAWKAAKK